jgi:hypothetical protein
VYVQRNIAGRSCNRCGSGEAVRLTHSECVFVQFSKNVIKTKCVSIVSITFYEIFLIIRNTEI